MAGLVPAIHVLQYLGMAGGYVYFTTNRPNGILYVCVTNDLVRRVFEHRSRFVKGFTKKYGLKTLVYFEQFETIELLVLGFNCQTAKRIRPHSRDGICPRHARPRPQEIRGRRESRMHVAPAASCAR